ncbi:MAG: hypothetical protein Q9M28_03730 [Mariprofundaceae bacterium]|nr:hypothetical protein [Mariprofundaceae bacterium]
MDPTQVVLISPDDKSSMVFHGSLNGQQRPAVWGGSAMRLDQDGKVETHLATLTQSGDVNCASDSLSSISRYGNYTAIFINPVIVKNVVVQAGDIYVQLDAQVWKQQFSSGKIQVLESNKKGSDYSPWSDAKMEKVVSISNRDKKGSKKGHTWRIQTSAKFIEYRVNGELVLHLKRD